MKRRSTIALLAALPALLGWDCSGSKSTEPYNPVIDPADFVSAIDNPYYPFVPGTVFLYSGQTDAGTETGEVTVTHDTKQILGVTTTVIHDVVKLNDTLAEETWDWYAQDKDGNVWYFGEDSKEYAGGHVISTEGSWEAGKDGAKPGIIMQASPQTGQTYRQEYLRDVAEDMARVLSVNDTATVPYGTYNNCLKTEDWSALDAGVREHKYYSPGVGLVLEVTVKGGSGRVELTEVIRP